MKKFSKLMLIALSFGILTVVLSLVPSKPAGAAGSASGDSDGTIMNYAWGFGEARPLA